MLSKRQIIIAYDEIALKSKTSRRRFIDILKQNINKKAEEVWEEDGRLFCIGNINEIVNVFGVSKAAYVIKTSKDIESISKEILSNFGKEEKVKIEVTRADKTFPLKSPEIRSRLVDYLKDKMDLSVKERRTTVFVEIRHKNTYIYANPLKGPGGLPYGSSGHVLLLFSGGYDSTLSAYLMAKRGLKQTFLFFSHCDCLYKDVENVWNELFKTWGIGKKLIVVNIRPIVEEILSKVPTNMRQIILKRFMYRIATSIAKKMGVKAIVTGESLGQVSTQTLDNLYVLNNATDLIVLRPLIGLNKKEIIDELSEIIDVNVVNKVKERCNISGRSKVKVSTTIGEVEKIESKLNIDLDEIIKKRKTIKK